MNELKIYSFNCEGFNSSTQQDKDVYMLNVISILYETWLFNDEVFV